MGIPSIRCEKCGYAYSVMIKEAMNDKGIRESYLAIDPEHPCLGGVEMKLETLPEPMPDWEGEQ